MVGVGRQGRGQQRQQEGYTPNYIRVAAKYDPLLVGEIKPLRLAHVNALGLMEAEEVGILEPLI